MAGTLLRGGGSDKGAVSVGIKNECEVLSRFEDLFKSLVKEKPKVECVLCLNVSNIGLQANKESKFFYDSTNRAARCLDSFLSTYGHFKGKNVIKYLKDFESKMQVNLIEPQIALNSFITLVEESLHVVVIKLLDNAEGDWTLFSCK
jgi:hypothetical protein